jgi:hypothetical protein
MCVAASFCALDIVRLTVQRLFDVVPAALLKLQVFWDVTL